MNLEQKSSSQKPLHQLIKELLNDYQLSNVIKADSLEHLLADKETTSCLTLEEEDKLNECILEKLSVKLSEERGFRRHTEEQIEKLVNQNKRQIDTLRKMIKISPRKQLI